MPKKATLEDSKFVDYIIKKYGENIIERNEDIPNRKVIPIPTGSPSLDISIGIGGIPRGKFTEIYGPESSAKTSLCLSISKQAIELGLKVLYVEPENSLDYKYIEMLVGTIDSSKFVLAQPETAEQTLNICESGVKSGEFQLIILDSVASLAPEAEKEDEFEKSHVAIIPRRIAAFLRRNAYEIRNREIAFIFVNQVRDIIGSYVGGFESPGGHALKHFTALRIQLNKSLDIEVVDKENAKVKTKIGIYSRYLIKKNKLARPFRSFNFPFYFGKGIDAVEDLVNFAEMLNVLVLRGSFYTFNGEVIGQGLVKTVTALKSNKELLDKIKERVYTIGNGTANPIDDLTDLDEKGDEIGAENAES